MKEKTSIIFKVQLKAGLWRKIQISSSATLDQLSSAILSAFEFDNDHLYGFFMDNRAWSQAAPYWSPYNAEPPFADKKKLSTFQFQKGDKFKYVFDFGDDWRFQVTVADIINEDTPSFRISGSKGEAPSQYGDLDDDDDEDEL